MKFIHFLLFLCFVSQLYCQKTDQSVGTFSKDVSHFREGSKLIVQSSIRRSQFDQDSSNYVQIFVDDITAFRVVNFKEITIVQGDILISPLQEPTTKFGDANRPRKIFVTESKNGKIQTEYEIRTPLSEIPVRLAKGNIADSQQKILQIQKLSSRKSVSHKINLKQECFKPTSTRHLKL